MDSAEMLFPIAFDEVARLLHGPPSSEDDLCRALAAALRERGLEVLVSEDRGDGKRPDLLLPGEGAEMEVKYWRPIPSGYNNPQTQQFGQLLGDVAKLARGKSRHQWALLVTHTPGYVYLVNRGLLPVAVGGTRSISPRNVQTLPPTAARYALADGPWPGVSLHCGWRADIWGLKGLAWRISRASALDADILHM